jgi:hypothetical protein
MNGWHDLTGDISSKSDGLTSPTLHNFNGMFRGWFYKEGNRADIIYHIPHDYAIGTDIFIHVHWSHNGQTISGDFDVTHYMSYAKGHGQSTFTKELHINQVIDANNTASLLHRVDEIQVSSMVENDGLLMTPDLEPDGIVTNSFVINKIPTIVGGTQTTPMVLCVDIHYQSTDRSTKNKEPDFYK